MADGLAVLEVLEKSTVLELLVVLTVQRDLVLPVLILLAPLRLINPEEVIVEVSRILL